MSRLERLVTTALIVVVLGVQLAVVLPPMTQRLWYWPFLNYPMYAQAHYPGEDFDLRQLRIIPCDGSGTARAVSWQQLDLLPFLYEWYLRAAGASSERATRYIGADSAIRVLSRQVRAKFPNSCRVQVWQHTARLGDPDTYVIHGKYALEREWSLRGSGDDTTASGATR